ncbi:MAG: hypothetical protein ACI8XB_001747 [Patiriisocius sp.]|jgi:hypothetical protein
MKIKVAKILIKKISELDYVLECVILSGTFANAPKRDLNP